ncbi:lipid-transfer protein [Prauserella marina]|uniref:Acetyl-CoA acetyltransferase n=1 Tax=Prauserella marina TaxID=530584 RepID=A0A222VQU0_9PSEU|nr:lipid-transfer protein [Prauserella marina]ASR36278.1 lipid-transfer protein [Prauserella marina]PWV77054.1 acetyl-CoA acetyltransferase [Prauserella marina]SDD03334.1 Acetyl-CoA acetyltransferase [Prauserella marina]
MSGTFSGVAAIAGIGATEFSKNSGRSEWQLACECVLAALDDAGLGVEDVDGFALFTMENNPEIAVARALGIPRLSFFSRIPHGGGGACAPVQQAALAVATGVADVVVVYRAFNERSGHRFGAGPPPFAYTPSTDQEYRNWINPYGLLTPAQQEAFLATRYLHKYGATTEDFGRVSVLSRKHAATNPKAWFYQRPITLEEHQNSRWIAEPLRLLDCCQESDGGQALVIVSTERARDLRHPPAVIRAAAQGSGPRQISMSSYYRDDIDRLPEVAYVAEQMWRQAGIGPSDIDAAVLYDAFTPMVLLQLEEYGFCGIGEAKDLIASGALELDGKLPVNTHGGQLGEGYIHGVNGIAEGVRLVRGTSVNQPAKTLDHVLVTGGSPVPHSAVVLGTG